MAEQHCRSLAWTPAQQHPAAPACASASERAGHLYGQALHLDRRHTWIRGIRDAHHGAGGRAASRLGRETDPVRIVVLAEGDLEEDDVDGIGQAPAVRRALSSRPATVRAITNSSSQKVQGSNRPVAEAAALSRKLISE